MCMETISPKGRQEKAADKANLAQLIENHGQAKRACYAYLYESTGKTWSDHEQREIRQELQRLSDELLNVQENERRRIAADLHDGIGQTLSLLKITARAAIEHLESNSVVEALQDLAGLDARIQDVLTELRRVCLDLRPPMLDDLGILPTLSWLLREVEESGSGLSITKVVTVDECDVPEKLKITLFRIVQEALCNIAKHADASCVRVIFLRTEDGLRLAIEDDGRGFDTDAHAKRGHAGRGLGVKGMMERVNLSGGTYQLDSAPGQGTRIHAFWPIERTTRTDWAERPMAA